MSDPADLTVLANLKQWLALAPAATADDALLERAITAYSKYVQQWMNRTIAQASYTEVRDGTGGFRMSFANYPVTAVASLTVDDLAIPQSTAVAVPGYVFNATSIALRGYQFTRDMQNVVMAYTAGYATTPPELEQAVIEMIQVRYKSKEWAGYKSKSLAGETVAFDVSDIPASAKTIFSNWRKVIPL